MTQQTKCANCGETTTQEDIRPLYELPNLYERLDPGSEVPAGECRECGAFVYLIPQEVKINNSPNLSTDQGKRERWIRLRRADAHLTAAAPALLRAADLAVHSYQVSGRESFKAHFGPVVDMLQAAIAKAEHE